MGRTTGTDTRGTTMYFEDCLACQYEAGEITQAYDDHIHTDLAPKKEGTDMTTYNDGEHPTDTNCWDLCVHDYEDTTGYGDEDAATYLDYLADKAADEAEDAALIALFDNIPVITTPLANLIEREERTT